MADKLKNLKPVNPFTLMGAVALAIDGIAFAGSNEIVAMGGYPGAKVSTSDVVVYLVVDALIRKGYLMNKDLGTEVFGMFDDPSSPYSIEAYRGVISAVALSLKDSLRKKKLVILNPLIKAVIGSFGVAFVDDIFGLKKIK